MAPWPETLPATTAGVRALTLGRYRELGHEPYWFAWGKLHYDPMFPRLRELVGRARHLLDLGAGYGVPAVWLLAQESGLRVTAVESDPVRARVAERAIGERGTVLCSDLSALPASEAGFDRVLLIDVGHYLDDAAFGRVLGMVKERLEADGLLIIRDTLPSTARWAWERHLEGWRLRRRGIEPHFRSAEAMARELGRAGYEITMEPTLGREETWFTLCIR